MGILDGLEPDQPATQPQGLYEALIATTVTADTDELFVSVPSFSPTFRYGPCTWAPRPGPADPVFPTVGDRALVAFSNDFNIWVVTWMPA